MPAAENAQPQPKLLRRTAATKLQTKAPDVDTHVEDVVPGVLQRAAFLVEPADDRTDVRLEESVADDDEPQREIERDTSRSHPQAEVAGGHQQAADDHALAVAEVAVGEDPADERRQVDQREEGPVDLVGEGRRSKPSPFRSESVM